MKRILAFLLSTLLAIPVLAYQVYTPAGTMDVNYANTEGLKRTYSVVIADFVPAATATDFLTIVGAVGKTVTVTQIRITASATATISQGVYLYKRTALNTAGTATQPSIAKHDSADAAPAAVVNQYSANPSGLGAGILIRSERLALAATTAGIFPVIWTFADRPAKGIKLKNATENLAFNWAGAAVPAGTNLHIVIEWTEE
jgi:hypothetical protein